MSQHTATTQYPRLEISVLGNTPIHYYVPAGRTVAEIFGRVALECTQLANLPVFLAKQFAAYFKAERDYEFSHPNSPIQVRDRSLDYTLFTAGNALLHTHSINTQR